MTYVVLKDLPQGQHPGDVVELPEAVGRVLVLVGAARLAEPEEPRAPRRTYRRRDLRAEP